MTNINKISVGRITTFSLLAATLVVAATLPFAPLAKAGDTECDGTLELADSPYDNVKVEKGKSCTIEAGVVIKGNLDAKEAVDIFSTGVGTKVRGNVQIQESTGTTELKNLKVRGDVKVEKTHSENGGIDLTNNKVRGNLESIENHVLFHITDANTVKQNMKIEKNTVTDTIFDIKDNDVEDNLECKENTPDPTVSGNDAGDAKDQCDV